MRQLLLKFVRIVNGRYRLINAAWRSQNKISQSRSLKNSYDQRALTLNLNFR